MTAAVLRTHRRFTLGLPAVILLAALLAMAGVGLLGTLLAQEQLGEARAAKAAAVAEAVQHDLERAIGYGIPLERIQGVEAYLQGIAGRNPDLGFLAVTGTGGGRLYGAPVADAARLDTLAESLRGEATPATRAATLQPIARDGFLIVRVPIRIGRGAAEGGGAETVRPNAGHVLVGVQPKQVRGQILGELVAVACGALAVLVLLAEVAGALSRASFRAPLVRLARVMEEAAGGRFTTLIGRRPRDQVGRVLFAFNAAVYGLHDRRQRFAAHAEEVRSAVFDPEVAGAVERTRAEALAALGSGLETAPRRVVDARSDDARPYAALAATAATLAATAGLVVVGPPGGPTTTVAGLLAAALVGGFAGFAVPARWRRWSALLAVVGMALAAGLLLRGGALPGLLLGALCGGVSTGLAVAYARRQVGEGAFFIARAAAAGLLAAGLWGEAVGWDATALAASAFLPAMLAALMARSFVVPRT
ncbi:HAMP domain-containing protein [Azospirillum doebereinerae]